MITNASSHENHVSRPEVLDQRYTKTHTAVSLLPLYWATQGREFENFGDYLGVLLLKGMGYEVTQEAEPACLLTCGTTLNDFHYKKIQHSGNFTKIVVWGSGAGYDMFDLLGERRKLEFSFRAVRGPLTRSLLALPLNMPLGDPAVLLPLFYPRQSLPKIEQEMKNIYVAHSLSTDLKIPEGTDATLSTHLLPNQALSLVSQIACSKFVLTSSLYGAIVAQSYGVPWAPYAPGPLRLNRFKWMDWLMYLGIEAPPMFVQDLQEGQDWWMRCGHQGRLPDTEPLLDAFPHDLAIMGSPEPLTAAPSLPNSILNSMTSLREKPVEPKSYAFTSPFDSLLFADLYGASANNVFGKKVIKEADFRQKLGQSQFLPEIMIMHNFVVERAAILSVCREVGINTIHVEDGFFPHYGIMHADPLGFCWESSLPRMTFRKCAPRQRDQALSLRNDWLDFTPQELPIQVKPPFVLWPLQLINDRVNHWDLNVADWSELLRHFRECLPEHYQLVLKEHPRDYSFDSQNTEELIRHLPNTVLVPKNANLKNLLLSCSAVAGANSTVLYEGRLIFHKPAYVYARGWYTNHTELFYPVSRNVEPRPLNLLSHIENNQLMRTDRLDGYTDWFLAQLLARQITREEAEENFDKFQQKAHRLSYQSFLEHGEDIFS